MTLGLLATCICSFWIIYPCTLPVLFIKWFNLSLSFYVICVLKMSTPHLSFFLKIFPQLFFFSTLWEIEISPRKFKSHVVKCTYINSFMFSYLNNEVLTNLTFYLLFFSSYIYISNLLGILFIQMESHFFFFQISV